MIPKQIFQTWEVKEISPELQNIVNLWKTHNPDYAYELMDASERQAFIRDNFDTPVLEAYNRIVPGAFKADFWRYCILYIRGGIYADLDTICMNSLDKFIDGCEFVTVIDLNTNRREGKHNLSNSFIASMPRHPILLGCINRIVKQVLEDRIPRSKLDISGPGVLGRETNIYLKRAETDSFVGKEGMYPEQKMLLLKFNRMDERVGILGGETLFQNKNGNEKLREIYWNECLRIKTIDWIHTRPWLPPNPAAL